jgi:NAD(P)-dependent dehydrogenase (short-subunit alcohol dehydrogenase family)
MSRFGRPILVLAGAAEGLGASIAKMFAAAGHDVLGLARSDRATARLTELVGEAGGEYSHLACDVTKPAQVTEVLLPHADRITVLVHNAHTLLIKPFEETARRGGANFAAFASAKFALRGLAQSMAREFGPHGVHVAHVVIDGLIDAPQSDRRFGQAQSARMDPDAVARAYLALATQHPSAWTHELDLRPFSGRF